MKDCTDHVLRGTWQVIDNSVRATRAFVKQYLSDTITRAQSSIASYGAQYSERMFVALTTCQQGAILRLAGFCNTAMRKTSCRCYAEVL